MSVTCPNCQCYFNPVNDDIHSVPSRPSANPVEVKAEPVAWVKRTEVACYPDEEVIREYKDHQFDGAIPLYASPTSDQATKPPPEIPAWVADFINRRAAVESEMMSAESADKEQLRKWALRLGVPSQYGNGLHDGSVKGEKS